MATPEEVCAALGRYYKSLKKPYDNLLSEYCDDNGLVEDFAEELEQPPEDCLLVDFDEDFPFSKEPKDKAQAVYDMIRKCRDNPDITFKLPLPTFDQAVFNINKNELAGIKKLYQEQCPVLWNQGMSSDHGFLHLLAVARKHNVDYLLHLVDDYSRDRVKHIEEKNGWSETDWAKNHKHFRNLRSVKVAVPDPAKGAKSTPHREVAKHAVISFGARCCPKMMFTNMMSINDSLEVTANFIFAAINFISNLVKSRKTLICPFQVDMCIAVGAPKVTENNMGLYMKQGAVDAVDDDDDDDDDDGPGGAETVDESQTPYVDCVGNVEDKLKKNGLKYKCSPLDLSKEARIFDEIYTQFVADNKLEQKDDKTDYLHKKRLITFVDRRKAKGGDDENEEAKSSIYMYEPPQNCHIMADNAVPEWGISASRTCLLPNMQYGDGTDAIGIAESDNSEKKEKEKDKEKLKNSNIGASFHCKAGLLTFSFHVKSEDVIRCYMYWNGQIIRFMPEDIKTVLPKMFNMEFEGNKAYITDKDQVLDEMIKEMQRMLVDDEFEAFQQSYA